MENTKPQKRVAFLADFACNTGFAQVAHAIVAQLLKDAEIDYYIDVVGINYYGLPNAWQQLSPRVRIFPASVISGGDLFGRRGFLSLLTAGVYDIAFMLQDTFNIEPITQEMLDIRTRLVEGGQKPFKTIFYYPIDAAPKENWIKKSVSLIDLPVVYTQYGYEESIKCDESLKEKLRVIPHGVDEKIFFPVSDNDRQEFRHTYFSGLADNRFLVTNINRNQPRKDIARTMQIFALFKQQCPEALLYLHMKTSDVAYNLDEVARLYDLIPEKDYIIPPNFNEHDGIDVGILNLIYNASDVVMTTTLGEGWGLSITEAMAAKTPVIAPNHTSLTEIIGTDRGTLVTAGRSMKDWIVMANDNERQRPIVEVAEYVDRLMELRNNRQKAQELAENAYKFVIENWTWEKVGLLWREVFKLAVPTQKLVKVGRNDPCFCGSGKKFKVCHYGT
jgi:D-inositol-3-phosphate glycosyltransferase